MNATRSDVVLRFADRACTHCGRRPVMTVHPGRRGISVSVRTTRGLDRMIIQSEIPDRAWCSACFEAHRGWQLPWIGVQRRAGVNLGAQDVG